MRCPRIPGPGRMLLLAALLAPAGAAPARAAPIDTWQTLQFLATPPAPADGTVGGPGIVGGTRGSNLQALLPDASSLTIAGGTLTLAVSPAAAHNVFLNITWAGPPPGLGLGGADLTDAGTATAFVLPLLRVDGAAARYDLFAADTAPHEGSVTGILPAGTRDGLLVLPFSLFIDPNHPVRVDMARVAKVELSLEVAPGGTVVLGPLETRGPNEVPEPGGLALVALAAAAAALTARPGPPRPRSSGPAGPSTSEWAPDRSPC